MSDSNQYQAPQSQVDKQMPQAFAKPKIFSVSGRIGRIRFLAYTLAVQLIMGIPNNLLGFILAPEMGVEGQVIILGATAISAIISLVLFFMFAIQRSHDMNSSGWLSLILLIPVIGYLVFLFAPGAHGTNRYGAPPQANGVGVILIAFILPIVGVIGILAAIAIPAYNGYLKATKEAQQMEQSTEQR
ncbi:hypothetical protein MNBD_GAMMA21-2208 [hydrothermal vent metagenome]|uniref:DUF805 domain-containing protein n=1 Tax=hydrothermal vent metagenome TaxID=652676 RepID=A0A3B0ZY50_9ZZZZ